MTESLSILLIEDDLVDQMAMRNLLTREAPAYQLEIAGSVAQARSVLASRRFDVILADYKLSDGTAFDLMDTFVDQPVIFVTGSGDEDVAVRALKAGAWDYMVKDHDHKYVKLVPHRIGAAVRQWRAERELRESIERYRDILDNCSDLVQSVGADGRLLYVNRGWRDTLGYTEEEIPAMTVFDLIAPDQREHCGALFQQVLQGEQADLVEMAFIAKDGRRVELEGNVNSRSVDGKVVSTRGIFRDVTQRNRAAEVLKLNEARLNRAQRLAQVGSWEFDLGTFALTWSDEHYRLFELEKTPPDKLYQAYRAKIHPDDLPLLDPLVRHAVETGESYSYEHRVVCNDGSTRHILGIGEVVMDAEGRPALLRGTAQDITERKHAEERHRSILRSAIDGFWIVDSREGCLLEVNDAYCRMSGYSAVELLQMHVWDLDADADREAVVRQFAEVRAHGSARFERRHRRKDGQHVHVEVSTQHSEIRAGVFVVFVQDISQRKQAEAALQALNESLEHRVEERATSIRALEARIDHLLSNTPVIIYSRNASDDFATTFVSNNVRPQCGYEPREFLSNPGFWVERLHPDDRERVLAGMPRLFETTRHAHEYRFLCADGTYRWYRDELTLVRAPGGKPLEMVGCMVDITARKRAEEARIESERIAHAALDALTAEVAILDEHGVVQATNETWDRSVQSMALPAESRLVGTNYLESWLAANKQDSEVRQGIQDVIAGRLSKCEIEYIRDSPTESRQFVCRVTRFAGDGPARVVVAYEDITQMRLLELQQRQNQRLEALGTLAGGVAHDLNNSLLPILLSLGLLRTEYPQDTQLLDILHASVQRAADMVRQLLTFAKGGDGTRASVNPAYLTEELHAILSATFPKNIRLDIRCPRDIPTVLGDTTQLHQVLLNLCVNARDAMPMGGTLTIEASAREIGAPELNPGRYVVLGVSDTGTGMSPEVMERIFDPFFTTKGPDKGTGLGLSTALGIVKSHGGFLRPHSRPGQGSTFDVYLPIVEAASRDTGHIAQTAPEFRGGGESILLVDDETAVLSVVAAVLRRLNFTPQTARDGVDGLTQVETHLSDLCAIVMDIHMPNMDGVAFAQAVRQRLPDVPIAAISGRFDEKLEAELKGLNVTVLLPKPFTEAALVEALRKLLRR